MELGRGFWVQFFKKTKFWFYVLVLKIILGFGPLPSYVLVSLSNPFLQGRLMQPSNNS
jgi:hypothetical protein